MVGKILCFLLFTTSAFSTEDRQNNYHLPNVLWKEIFTHLPLKDLGKVAQVSKKFKENSDTVKDKILRKDPVSIIVENDKLSHVLTEINPNTPISLHVIGDSDNLGINLSNQTPDLSSCLPLKNQIVSLTLENLNSEKNVQELSEIIGKLPHLRELHIRDNLEKQNLKMLFSNIVNPHKIEVIDFSYYSANDILNELCKNMKEIKVLKCYQTDLDAFKIENWNQRDVSQMSSNFANLFPKLETLSLPYYTPSFDAFLPILSHHPTLKRLEIGRVEMSPGLYYLSQNIELQKILAKQSSKKYNGLELYFGN
jgi:hypothetical protein